MDTPIDNISALAKKHGANIAALNQLYAEASAAVSAAQAQFTNDIKKAAKKYAASQDNLLNFLHQNTDVFATKKTMEMEGVKFGLRAGRVSVLVDDEAAAVEALVKHYGGNAHAFFQQKTTVNKSAVKGLSPDVLEAAGITVTTPTPEVFVSEADDQARAHIASALAIATPA